MSIVLRRDAAVFFNPPQEIRTELGDSKLTCFCKHSYIDHQTGELLEIKQWLTEAEIKQSGICAKTELPPPMPGEIYYEGPVWEDDPARTLAALKAFLETLPIPESTLHITMNKA